MPTFAEEQSEILILTARLKAQADEYLANPAKGFAAGYQPEVTFIKSPEISSPQRIRRERTRADWLRAIAERDLEGEWEWSVHEAPEGGSISIRGRAR